MPDRAALIHGEQVVDWQTFAGAVQAAASGLKAAGIGEGDRVLVHGRNGVAYVQTMWACWLLGAVWVPTNVRLTPPEVAFLAENSAAAAHLFDPGCEAHAAAARGANPALRFEADLSEGWAALCSHKPLAEAADVGRDHPCWLFYTSGTTGRPKGAMLTHGQMAFVVVNHLCDLMPGTTERDVSLVVAPLSHGAGIHAVTQVAAGAASVLPEADRLDPSEAWRLVARHRVSNLFTVPTILNRLVQDEAVDRHDHTSLRYVIYAGAPMYRADQVRALRTLGPVLVQYYGLGEVTGAITVLPPRLHAVTDDPALPTGSVGMPRTGMEIAIRDGEVVVRGPAVFAGYWANEAATAAAFRSGWFHTGDLGHLDERGFLHLTGRASDMFISGGSNVYPREIEEALLEHPAVAEACVVGLPHPSWGESGVAVVVRRPGCEATEEALRAHLEGRLARYKHPAAFAFWPELPRSGYGKVPKRDVRQQLEAQGISFTAQHRPAN